MDFITEERLQEAALVWLFAYEIAISDKNRENLEQRLESWFNKLELSRRVGPKLSRTKAEHLAPKGNLKRSDSGNIIIENARIKGEWSSNGLTAESLIRFDHSVMTYKILSELRPESLWDKCQYRSMYSDYETRNSKDLQVPRLITEHAKKGFYYSASKIWNDIPANIREIQTLGCFKKQLKAHLTS